MTSFAHRIGSTLTENKEALAELSTVDYYHIVSGYGYL